MGNMKKRKEENEYAFVFKNIKFVYGELFKKYPKVKWTLPISIVLAIALPFIAAFIPAVAVDMVSNRYGIARFIIGMALITFLYLLLSCIFEYANQWTAESNSWVRFIDFGKKIIHKVITMDYDHIEPQVMQEKITKGSWGIQWTGIQQFCDSSKNLVISFLGIFTYLTTIILLDYRIFLIIVLMSIANLVAGKYAREYMKIVIDENARICQKADYLYNTCTSIENGKDIRLYGMREWFRNTFNKLCLRGTYWQNEVERKWCVPKLCDVFFTAVRDIVAYYILISHVIQGDISIASFTAYLGVIAGFAQWISGGTVAYGELQKSNVNVNYYREIVQLPDNFKRTGGLTYEDVVDEAFTIKFEDVSFHYEGEDEQNIISHISFEIQSGERIALVGNNGAGKTTLIKLLCGFYRPTEGRILVAGKDIQEYNICEYFKLIGAVFQDIEPLKFMISQNITGKCLVKTEQERLYTCLRQADIYDKVMALKNKENTYISQRFSKDGIELSGGELQRLMLARALYKDAPILVLDEPTAALDPILEGKIYNEYSRITEGKTAIFISHRMASTRFCDRILVLNQGCIVEEGTHEELLYQNGEYKKIYRVQSRYYREKNGDETD